MKGLIRFLICFVISFVAVYLSGYGNTVLDISESLAITTFLGAVVVVSVICMMIWNTYANLRDEINKLYIRIDNLEEKLNKQDQE
jgi:uncharacterized membrane protein